MFRPAVIRLLLGASFTFAATGCKLFTETRDPLGKNTSQPFDNRLPVKAAAPATVITASATDLPEALPPIPSPPIPAVPAPLPLGTPGPRLHVLPRPSATGSMLNLAPGELPMDRAVELVRRIDEANADNQVLQARVRSLEAKANEREQAIAESLQLAAGRDSAFMAQYGYYADILRPTIAATLPAGPPPITATGFLSFEFIP